MIKQLQASRTCSVCGQKKPLVAFLQLAGDKGHIYGDICSSCRGAGLEKKKEGDEGVGHLGSDTRLQIDIKTKVRLEQDKKKHLKDTLDRNQNEKAKKDTLGIKETKDSKKREDAEKKQRDKYQSEAPKTSTEAPKTPESKNPKTQGFYQEKTRINKEFNRQAEGQQLGKKKTGFTAAEISRYVAATGRSVESLFGKVVSGFISQHQTNKNPAAAKPQTTEPHKTTNPQTTFANKAKAPEAAKKAEPKENLATEFMRKNFGKR